MLVMRCVPVGPIFSARIVGSIYRFLTAGTMLQLACVGVDVSPRPPPPYSSGYPPQMIRLGDFRNLFQIHFGGRSWGAEVPQPAGSRKRETPMNTAGGRGAAAPNNAEYWLWHHLAAGIRSNIGFLGDSRPPDPPTYFWGVPDASPRLSAWETAVLQPCPQEYWGSLATGVFGGRSHLKEKQRVWRAAALQGERFWPVMLDVWILFVVGFSGRALLP